MTLNVNEIYKSIQGESTYQGLPCIFVRLTGCSLRCSWCDSTYAFTGGSNYKIEDVLNEISQWNVKLIQITGGEPLEQEETFELIKQLSDLGYQVLLETGGHRNIENVDQRATIIMDIKTPMSKMHNKNNFKNFDRLKPNDQIKIIIGDKRDFDYALNIIKEHDLDNRFTVLISPVFDSIDLRVLTEWVLDSEINARVQFQMHKLIWGAKAKSV